MSEALQVAGCIAAAACAAAAMLTGDRRARAAALLAALVLAAALLLGEGWDELESLRQRPALAALVVVAAAAAIAALAELLRRRPLLLPLLLIACLPIRVPIGLSGDDVNLLLPLYVVVAAGALALARESLSRPGRRDRTEPRLLVAALAAAIVLYALQAAYSSDVGFAARNVGFFLVPFAATFVLLCEARWTPSLLRAALFVVVAEASLFAIVGVGQFALGEIFWNPALERSNDFHFYFRVNSLFWDPNIYGRYLALAAVLVAAVLMWSKDVGRIGLCAAALALLLAGLTFGFSQTSFISLLVGVTVLVALRWSALWTAVAAPAAAAAVVAIVIFVGGTSAAEDSPREISSGRTTLIEGGWKLARERPLLGHGSASFSEAFAEQEEISPNKTTVSHNEPVTVAAEQGLLGLLAYALLLAAAFWTLLAGMRRIAPGLGAPRDAIGDEGADAVIALARIALAGGFAALVIHTIGYAGYLTDPLTWALLAVAASLAAVPASRTGPAGPAS